MYKLLYVLYVERHNTEPKNENKVVKNRKCLKLLKN